MNDNIVPLKPNAHFVDTCGVDLPALPQVRILVSTICAALGVAEGAIRTESQLVAAINSMIPSEDDPEAHEKLRAANVMFAGVALAISESRTDLAGMALTATCREIIGGETPPKERVDRVLRLHRMARPSNPVE